MLFNWPSYCDSSTGTKSFYEVDYKELSLKCGLSFSKKTFMSPPRIKSSSPPNFHTEFQIALDYLLKLIKDVLSMKQQPWAQYHKVAKVIDNIVEYAKIESFYLRTISADNHNLQSSPSFCFVIQRLVRLTKDIHLLCKYAQKKELPEFTETRRILRELIRSIRKRCLKFIEIYSTDGFETSDGAMSNIQELLVAQFLQLVKFLMNFTKFDDHKKYVETSASGMSCSDTKINDIWSLTNSSLRQVQNEEEGGSSVSPIPQRHEIKKLNFHPHAGSVSTVPELLSLNDVLVRRKGSNTDDTSQPSARISYNGSIADLGGLTSLSRRTSSFCPPMVTIERRRTADESDRPKLSRDIKSSHDVLEGENSSRGGNIVEPVQGLRRANSITERKVGITNGKETARLEDVSELDSSVEQGSPKRARNYRELRRTRELWGIVDDIKSSAKPSMSKVDTIILPSRIVLEGESDSVDMQQAEQSGDEKNMPMSRINFMTENDIQTENEIEEEQPKLAQRFSKRLSVVTDKRIKLMTMVTNPELEPVTPKGTASEELDEEETLDMIPRRLNLQRGKTMFENTEHEECESPWFSPSPSPIKGRFVFKQEEIQEVNEDDSPVANHKVQPRNNTFVRPRIKRRNSTSIIASSSKSPRKVKAAMAAQKEILKERKREKQGYCYQKKFQNERRQDFLSKIFGDNKQIIQKHFEDAHGIDVNRIDKENKKPFIKLETEEDEEAYNNSPVKNMARLAYVPVTISESYNFFNKLRTERYEEVKVQPKKKQRRDLWKRAKDTLKAKEFRESLQEEDDALSPTLSCRNKHQILDVSSQGINNTLKSFKHKNTIFIGPLRKTRECGKIMQPARGFFIGEQKENIEVTEDLEISLMLARLAFRKGRHHGNLSPDTLNNRSFDDSRDNSGSGFSFRKRQGFFRTLFSPSPSGDTNNNSPRSDRSRSDSRDYGPAPASATKPSLFKSLFKLNALDISVLSPRQRGRSSSIESIKENASSASPNNRNQSSFSAYKRPSLFKSLFKMSFFDKEEKSSAGTPKICDWLDPETPSHSEMDSPSLRKSRSEHRSISKRFY